MSLIPTTDMNAMPAVALIRVSLERAEQELAALRAAIRETQRDLAAVRDMMPPQDEVIAHVGPLVEAAGARYGQEQGQRFLDHLAGRALPPEKAARDADVEPTPMLPFSSLAPLTVEALCFLLPNEMKAGLIAGIRRLPPGEVGLPTAERPAERERLLAKLAALERDEKELLEAIARLKVDPRPEVVAREESARRAAASAAKAQAERDMIEEAKRNGLLGTPRVPQAGVHRSPVIAPDRGGRS